jgi:hypothetical protein
MDLQGHDSTDATDAEIRQLREMWTRADAELEQRKAAARLVKLAGRKADLLRGSWKPECRCDSCLRAVLGMDPTLVCERGKSVQWW